MPGSFSWPGSGAQRPWKLRPSSLIVARIVAPASMWIVSSLPSSAQWYGTGIGATLE